MPRHAPEAREKVASTSQSGDRRVSGDAASMLTGGQTEAPSADVRPADDGCPEKPERSVLCGSVALRRCVLGSPL